MPLFIKKNQVEAVKFDGSNLKDIKDLLGKLGKEYDITEIKNGIKRKGPYLVIRDRWILGIGDYLVIDLVDCYTMNADTFELLHKPLV